MVPSLYPWATRSSLPHPGLRGGGSPQRIVIGLVVHCCIVINQLINLKKPGSAGGGRGGAGANTLPFFLSPLK